MKVRKAIAAVLCMAVVCCAVCGCQTSVRVSGRAVRPYEYPPGRFDGSLWKDTLWEDSNQIVVEDRHHTLAAVRVRTNYLYALATVLTFGLWAPMDVEWEENCD